METEITRRGINGHYKVRVISRSLVTRTVGIRAESEEEARAKVEQRITAKLKQMGYDFELRVVDAKERARLAGA
jgi:hypothetical protein